MMDKKLDRTLLLALAALGDTDAVIELGHFGNETHEEAIAELKKARKILKDGNSPSHRKPLVR